VFRKTSDLNPHLPTPENPRSTFTHLNGWPEECPRDYLHIVNVRHPYYRWISYWKHDLRDNTRLKSGTTDPLDALKTWNEEDFDKFSLWRVITQAEPRIDYIIHAESVLEDLRKLPFISDDFDWDFSSSKRQTYIPLGVSWDVEELRELTYSAFKQDYDNLGYGKWDDYDHLWDCSPNPVEITSKFSSKI
jgi:hypothetical protein